VAAGVAVTLDDAAPIPTLLPAATAQLYSVPLVNPLTTTGLAAAVPVNVLPPPVHVARYDVTTDPPSDAGGENVRLTLASPMDATTLVGAPGTTATGVVGSSSLHAASAVASTASARDMRELSIGILLRK
jgi:hypothetical protein